MVGITEVDTCLLAACTLIAVIGEVNEFDNIIFYVCLSHAEYIDVCLHTRLAKEKITRHLDAGKERISF